MRNCQYSSQLSRSKLINPLGSILGQPGATVGFLRATRLPILSMTDGVEPGCDWSVVFVNNHAWSELIDE